MTLNEKKPACMQIEQMIADGELPEDALGSIAECLGEEVRNFVMARCGSKAGDAEDIFQDVMLSAQKYLANFRGDSSLRSWLFKLAISACSHKRRGQKNDPSLHRALDDLTTNEPRSLHNPEMEVLVAEELSALHEAISQLRPEDRQMLAAAEWEELSLEEVASRHQTTVAAVKSRLFRIRRQLKETLAARNN